MVSRAQSASQTTGSVAATGDFSAERNAHQFRYLRGDKRIRAQQFFAPFASATSLQSIRFLRDELISMYLCWSAFPICRSEFIPTRASG